MVNPALCATTAMIAKLFYPYFELAFGAIYPAYASWKSMKNRDRHQYQRWMMYWVTYGSFQLVQIFTDIFIGIWFPFYYELKILFLVWLVSLNGHGARLLFTHVLNNELTKHEKTIDVYFDRTSGLGNEIVWRMWTECSKLAPKVISIFLRLMIATSEGLPYFDIASKQSTVGVGALSITDSDNNKKSNYNDPPMVDDINVLVMDSAVESDAISSISDDLIKSVRVSRAKSSGLRQLRTPSIDSLDSLLPMDCDNERTLVESHDDDQEWTPSSAKRKARKKSKPRVSKEKKVKVECQSDEQYLKQVDEQNKDEYISETGAPSDASNPSSPSKSKSKTRILRKPRVIKRPIHYAS